MLKKLKKMNDILSSRKGAIICGVVVIIAIGGLVGQKVYKAKEAAKIEAIQIAKEDAETKKAQDLYAKQKAEAEAKALEDVKALEATQAAKEEEAEVAKASAEINRVGRSEAVVYEEIHTMVNSIVIADDVWEKKLITKENIVALIAEINNSKFQDKKELYTILNRWKAGDFTQADSDHNYVWGKVGGTVGRATGVDSSKLPTWASK